MGGGWACPSSNEVGGDRAAASSAGRCGPDRDVADAAPGQAGCGSEGAAAVQKQAGGAPGAIDAERGGARARPLDGSGDAGADGGALRGAARRSGAAEQRNVSAGTGRPIYGGACGCSGCLRAAGCSAATVGTRRWGAVGDASVRAGVAGGDRVPPRVGALPGDRGVGAGGRGLVERDRRRGGEPRGSGEASGGGAH